MAEVLTSFVTGAVNIVSVDFRNVQNRTKVYLSSGRLSAERTKQYSTNKCCNCFMITQCCGPSSIPTCVLLTVIPLKMIYELKFYIHVVFDHRFCTQEWVKPTMICLQ